MNKKQNYDIYIEHQDGGFYVYNKDRFITNAKDRRNKKYKKFKKENGFTPDQTWNLYLNTAIFILPRLKYFRDNTIGYPCNFKNINEWKKTIDKMIFSFENIIKYGNFYQCPTQFLDKYKNEKDALIAYTKQLNDGFKLFGKYYMHLWW